MVYSKCNLFFPFTKTIRFVSTVLFLVSLLDTPHSPPDVPTATSLFPSTCRHAASWTTHLAFSDSVQA